MIFRSKKSVALLIALGLGTSALWAQEEGAGELPDVHVVQEGETLWGLSTFYLDDPYLWPEIYRLNTLVVEDPHWIFPGEELHLVPQQATVEAAVLVPVDSADAEAEAFGGELAAQELEGQEIEEREPPPIAETIIFRRGASVTRPGITMGGVRADFDRPVRRIEFYAAGFLTEGEELPWGDVLGAAGSRASDRMSTASSATIFEQIEIRAPESALYQVGDSLLVASIRGVISGWGNVVVPTGIVRVTTVSGRRVLAQVLTQFGVVLSHQSSLPLEAFTDPGNVSPLPVEGGITGSVIRVRDRHPVPGQQNIVFVDFGRADGVVPGDIFEIVKPATVDPLPDAPQERIAILRIVHVRERSSSGMLMQLYRTGVVPGATVRLIRKMPT